MVFSGNRRGERVGDTQENGIFSDNFGGLNTTASDLNCPYEDSPNIINCDIDVSGKVVKRKGTKLMLSEVKQGKRGYTLLSFVTGLRYTYLVEKFGKDLTILEVRDDKITPVVTKLNVWSSAAENIRANFVRTTELTPRVIMTTGVNQPVQVTFYEQQRIASATSSNFVFNNAQTYQNATLSNTVVYKNRQRVTPTGISYAPSGNLTLTGVSVAPGDVIDIVMVLWQHIVEAIYLEGKRISQQVTRFNVTKTDQNVAIPEELRWDFIANYPGIPFLYGYRVYKSDQKGDAYVYSTDLKPASSNQYVHGNGAVYDDADGGAVTPSPLFVTFGDILGTPSTPADPKEILIARRFDLTRYLNGGVPITAGKIKVYLDGVQTNQQTDSMAIGAYGDYQLLNQSGGFIADTTTAARIINFEAGDKIGIAYTSQVEIINTTTEYIGTAANSTVSNLVDGGCEPQYGLGLFADYYSGSFPRNVAIYENRLVYSGFPANPLRIAFSEVGDSYIPLRPYRLFQIDQAHTLANDPLDIPLQGRADDFITGLVTWQRSLFVFSRQAVYRISGSESGFTNVSKSVRLISTNGLVNAFSVTVTDKAILYLSDAGVYDLILGIDSEDFTANEKSIKIRKVFGVTTLVDREPLAWLSYDSVNQKVYLGLPIEELDFTSFKLFVYHVFREAWTEYQTVGGWNTFYGSVYSDITQGSAFLLSAVGYRDGTDAPVNRVFLKTEHDRYIDFADSRVSNGTRVTYDLSFEQRILENITRDKVYDYPVSVETSNDNKGFYMLPVQSIKDIEVEIETAPSSGAFRRLGDDEFVKRPNGYIFLRDNPGGNRIIRIRSRVPMTDSEPTRAYYGITEPLERHEPVAVYVDNIFKYYGSDYNVGLSEAGIYQVTLANAPNTNAVIEYGQLYQTFYLSPALTLQTFTALKRAKFIYVYFDNEDGMDIYTVGDINGGSGQVAEEIVGQYKQRLNASIAIKFESDFDGDVSYDLYDFASLVFDDALFDIFPSTNQFRRYVLFKESLLGIGYSYQLAVWSFDETMFKLSAYQISPSVHAERFINWTS